MKLFLPYYLNNNHPSFLTHFLFILLHTYLFEKDVETVLRSWHITGGSDRHVSFHENGHLRRNSCIDENDNDNDDYIEGDINNDQHHNMKDNIDNCYKNNNTSLHVFF